MINMTKEEIREELPDECNTTLEHADIHIKSAIESSEEGDYEQVAHDANMASLILRYIVLEYDDEKASLQSKERNQKG